MRAGIVGGSGYIGGELTRILLGHPQLELATVVSRQHVGKYIHKVHSNLRGYTTLKFSPLDVDYLAKTCEVVFTATPHGSSKDLVPKLLEANLKVIDMSADFRLKNSKDYPEWYGWEHTNSQLLEKAVYGLPELHRDQIRNSSLIAVPGCMATTTILGLAPLVKDGIIEKERIVVDLKVGSSGSGSKPSIASHHAERFGGVRPYKTIGHRHIAEIEQELNRLGNDPVRVSFTPHAVNMVRGILATIHTFPKQEIDEPTVWKSYRSFYKNEPFIRYAKDREGLYRLPDPKIVVGSNYCDIGFELDQHVNRLVVFTATDNLVKGAAGQAVQCLNIMYGIDEKTGIQAPALHPV
jgi:N-acetyl-gamma-glutamyl-phosphate/LysW-gamma-L-alpha-aminoadipyl-6-phosphate reductase